MISIIITIKDRQEYLDRQLNHIEKNLLGTDLQFELVVYDDGSTKPLAKTSAKFEYTLVRSKHNVGLIEARNIAFSHISDQSKYIFFLDDDLFVFNMTEYIRDAIKNIDDGYAVVTLPYINLPTYKYEQLSTFSHIFDISKCDDDVVYFFGGTSVFNTTVFRELGGLEGNYFIYLEEEDLALRLFTKGFRMKMLYGANYIGIHDQASGKNWEERQMYLLSNRMIFHKKFVSNFVVRSVLNSVYLVGYLLKYRSVSLISKSITRAKKVNQKVQSQPISTKTLLRFLMKRYFNI